MLGKKAAYAAVPAAALGLTLFAPATAFAGDDGLAGSLELGGQGEGKVDTTVAKSDIESLNGTDASGKAIVVLRGHEAHVKLFVRDVLEDAPHAQHFHIQGEGRCPTPQADTNGDGIISTVEGQPAYGSIGASLTTEGDTSAQSALAVDRFPTAPNGFITYQRTFEVNDATAQSIREDNAVIVVHGIDANDSGAYDGAAKSELNPALPLEATAPAACGGVDTIARVGGNLDLGGALDLNLDEIAEGDFAEDLTSGFNSFSEGRDQLESGDSPLGGRLTNLFF